jgi:LPXTG-motif cell wall-anchored protein
MRTQRRKQRKLRTGIALLVVFLLAFGTVLIGFGASVDPVVDPPGMRAGGNEPPIGDCVEYKVDSDDLRGVTDGQTIRYYFKDLTISGEKNVEDTDYVDITFHVADNDIESFDWQSNIAIGHVFVKGGSGGYLFSYDPPTTGDTNLFCGTGVSHITFYICGIEEPEYKLTVKKVVVDEDKKVIADTETFYFTIEEVAVLLALDTTKHPVKVGEDKVFDPFEDGSYVLTEVDLDEDAYELLGYFEGTIVKAVGDELTEELEKDEDDAFSFDFDGADKVITIVNMKLDDEEEPEEYNLTVKKVVVDEDKKVIADTETFYFTIEEVAVLLALDTTKHSVKVGEDKVFDPFEDGSYVLTEVDLDEDAYELLGYFEGTIVKAVGDELTEELEKDEDDAFSFDFDGADKVITIVNMKLDDEDEPGRGILNVNKVVTGNAPAVNTYSFVVREVVEEGEGWISEIQQLIPGTTTILDDLEPGDYTIEETQTRGANTVTYSLREFTVAESGTTRITITITNRFPSPGPGPGPSPRPRPTPDPRPEPQEVIEVETITPPFAPPIVEAPVLDQAPAAAPPVLPQTGDASSLALILGGLGVSISGLVFGIRKKEKNSSVTTLFK